MEGRTPRGENIECYDQTKDLPPSIKELSLPLVAPVFQEARMSIYQWAGIQRHGGRI